MSDLLFNIRFGTIHFQVHRSNPYVTIKYNSYWVENKPEKWLEVYHVFGRYIK